MPRKKSDFTLGLEMMLNNPNANPLTQHGNQAFKEMAKASNLPITEMLTYVGKKSKAPPKPTDEDRSKARLQNLESHSK